MYESSKALTISVLKEFHPVPVLGQTYMCKARAVGFLSLDNQGWFSVQIYTIHLQAAPQKIVAPVAVPPTSAPGGYVSRVK